MRNDYRIIDDYVEIYLWKRKQKEFETTIIDLEDLDRVLKIDVNWTAGWREDIQSYYAQASLNTGIVNGKSTHQTLVLHRVIMQCEYFLQRVDHINHDTLFNRKINLRISPDSKNIMNRKGVNKNNKSGHRNVCMIDGYWRVQLQINKKNYLFPEKFIDVDEAGAFAEEMRKKYYGEFAGNS